MLSPIDVIDVGIDISANDEQPEKAEVPIDVVDAGIEIFAKDEHLEKA